MHLICIISSNVLEAEDSDATIWEVVVLAVQCHRPTARGVWVIGLFDSVVAIHVVVVGVSCKTTIAAEVAISRE